MAEFEVNGITYKTTKLPLKPALGLLLKIGPLAGLSDIHSIGIALSEIPEEKVWDIIGICLAYCERQLPNGNGWAKTWDKASRQPMYDDIGLVEAGTIIGQIVNENFADFLRGQS